MDRSDRFPKRIVCLTEETTETLYLLGAQDRIAGISGFTQRPPQARKEKPLVSAFITAEIPKILAVKPDLVLAFSDLQADIVRGLVAAGCEVMTFNQRSVEEILRMITMLGALVGKSNEASALIDRLERGLDAIRESAAKLPCKPRVYFEEWPDPIITGIRWVSELIEIAGGEDLFAELRDCPLARDRIVTADRVRDRDPQLIIGSWCGKMVKKQKIVSREGWSEVSAVKHDRIVEVKSVLILQPGPAALTDGVREVHEHIARVARQLAS
jgi:iron complex transport system substrate-binding protein